MKTKIKDVKAGTVIHTEKPFVHILSSKLRTERCDWCFENKKLMKCSGCQYVYYCGKLCQKEAWGIHKYECSNLKRVAPRVVPDAAKLLSRLIIKLKIGGDLQKGYFSETSFRMFKDLMSHYSDIKEDMKRMEHFTSLCGVLFEYLGETFMPNSAELMGIYGRMCVNGFNILDSEMLSIGTGIYLGASIVDHSCKPNAVAVFEGTTIYYRTLQFLPVLDWSQVFISYIDLLNKPEDRQKELQSMYYFVCQCSVCLDVQNVCDMNSAICPNNNCDSSVNMSNIDNKISCEKCNELVEDDFKQNYSHAIEFTLLQMEDMRHMSTTDLDLCKMCLKKQQGFFTNINLLHVKTLDLAFESCIQMNLWDEAEEFGIRLIPGFRRYYGPLHPLLGLLYLKVGKILVFKGNVKKALEYLIEAGNVLKITHGESHSLYRRSFLPLLNQAKSENASAI